MSEQVDSFYYEVAKSGSLSSRLLIIARDQIFDDLMSAAAPLPDDRILDVGVSDVLEEGANVLERRYPHQDKITACGLGSAVEFQRAFPAVDYRQIVAGQRLPFPDQAFGLATCNAVLEHVGSEAAQRFLVEEMCRVARTVFVSVPHRWFPVEHHTAIPLLHYTRPTFRLACALLGKSKWTKPAHLLLMSRSRLRRAFGGRSPLIAYTGIKLGPFSSNLYAVYSSS